MSDSDVTASNVSSLYVSELHESVTDEQLLELFSRAGTVDSATVCRDELDGRSLGYAYVNFSDPRDAATALELNGTKLNDKEIYVRLLVREERVGENGLSGFTNVYVKNLTEKVDDEGLRSLFGPFGTITSAVVMKDETEKSRGFGFVNFQSPDDAAAAVEKMNGITNDGVVLFVGKALKKSELRASFEQLSGANLYLKNIDNGINEDKLKELFSKFGTITSCKLITTAGGLSMGYGFVSFSTPEEASKAMKEMNKKMIGRKPLYVAVAEYKEDRKTRLQAHYARYKSMNGITPLPTETPEFPPQAPRPGPQQLYFGQDAPNQMPPPLAGYGFPQQQLLPVMRPRLPPYYMLPFHHLQRQGLPTTHMGLRPVVNFLPPHALPQSQPLRLNSTQVPMFHLPNTARFQFPNAAMNGIEPSIFHPHLVSQAMPLPMYSSVPPGPVPRMSLTSALGSRHSRRQGSQGNGSSTQIYSYH